MKVGTADILDVTPEPKRRAVGRLGGSGTSGGSNDGGRGGPGGDRPDETSSATDPFVPDKSRILTGFLLVVVCMTFGGLAAAYIVIATNGSAEWRPFDLPIQVWISTALILASSVVYHLGKLAVDRAQLATAKNWFVITTVLGAAFISSQVLAWFALFGRGLYIRGNPYAGFFYILTAVHAVHVIGGITALGTILLRTWNPNTSDTANLRRVTLAQTVGWYWHFMGAIWIVLLVMLGFWK